MSCISVICPVCGGRQKVPPGFYDSVGMNTCIATNAESETCRTCEGLGVIYGFGTDRKDFVNPILTNAGRFTHPVATSVRVQEYNEAGKN